MGYSKYRRSKRKTTVRRRKSTGTKRKSTKRRTRRRSTGRVFRSAAAAISYLKRSSRRRPYRRRYKRRGMSKYMLDPTFLAGVNAAADVMHADIGTQTEMPSELGARVFSEVGEQMPATARRLASDFS